MYLDSIKNYYNSIIEKQITQVKQWAQDLNRHLSKEDTEMANKHMKNCPTSPVIGGTQIRTTVGRRFAHTRMTVTKRTHSVSVEKVVEEPEPSEWGSHFGKQLVAPQKVKHRVIT